LSVDGEERFADLTDAQLAAMPVARAAIRSRVALLREVERGAKVIMSPARFAYFDLKINPSDPGGQDWAGTISLDKAASWRPTAVLPGLDPAAIVGLEAAVWTEFIHSEAELQAMVDQRLAGFAAVADRFYQAG
ncbi:MAG: family 20 glycosylhydrolase, partial [Propionibacteriaceae bacterium]|nr:family 20 glycosylhydrolase [Propionibacteriaceae bacterium]